MASTSSSVLCFKVLSLHLKDKAEPREAVYKLKCQRCDGCYMRETKRKLAVRGKVHKADVDNTVKDRVFTHGRKENNRRLRKNKCAIMDLIDWHSARMVERERESDWTDRGIKETIIIRKHPQNFNRDMV